MTGNGLLNCWKKEAFVTIDEEVFAFRYLGNGRMVYLKQYDITTGLGDLYYYDGQETHLLDTSVTAIFMD